ncbi:MAG: DUF115 domain-containing protein [Spirochaetales bacterium]|nr:DUF115 domain-containing protein [Spirochaetales bacterium]
MIEVFDAKDGSKSLKVSGIQIHSSYSPLKEVEKYLQTFKLHKKNSIILCGDMLGHLYTIIKKRYPDIKIISLLYSSDFLSYFSDNNSALWYPGSNISLYEFLQNNLKLLDTIGLEIISWPASGKAYPTVYQNIQFQLNQFLLENSGSLNTIKQFGNLWLRNTFSNFLSLKRISLFPGGVSSPLFIAASGPSLSKSFAFLKEYRKKITIWALPSSLKALLSVGIEPDLIIQTDPGYYATHHLRDLKSCSTPVAMPLSACRSIWNYESHIYLFSQGTGLEKSIFKKANARIPEIPPAGTVAVTALFLSMEVNTEYPVILLGYDFSHSDINTHVHPNAFMSIFQSSSRRTAPLLGTMLFRSISDDKNQTSPLKTYSGWLQRFSEKVANRVYRLHASPISLGSIKDIDESEARLLCKKGLYRGSTKLISENHLFKSIDRNNILNQIVQNWDADIMSLINTAKSGSSVIFNPGGETELALSLNPSGLMQLKKKWPSLSPSERKKETIEFGETLNKIISRYKEEYLS